MGKESSTKSNARRPVNAHPSPSPNPAADASEIKTANKRTYIVQLWLIYPARTSPRWNVSYRRPSINCDKRANSGRAEKVSQTIISQPQIIAAVKCFFHNFRISKSSDRTQAKQAPTSPHHYPPPPPANPPPTSLPSCRPAVLHPPGLTLQHWVAFDAVISNRSDGPLRLRLGDPGPDPLSSPEKGPRRRWLQGYE